MQNRRKIFLSLALPEAQDPAPCSDGGESSEEQDGEYTVLEGGEARATPAWIVPWNKLPVQEKLPNCCCDLPGVRMEANG